MYVLEAWPCVVGLKICRPDTDRRRVVPRPIEVIGTDERNFLACVESCIILRIPSYTNDRVTGLELAKILQQIVREVVRMTIVASKVWKGRELDTERYE